MDIYTIVYILAAFTRRWRQNPVSRTLFLNKNRMMDYVQKSITVLIDQCHKFVDLIHGYLALSENNLYHYIHL
jgi:hypothetical protein